MRHLTLFVLLAALAAGCSKKKPPEPPDAGDKKETPPTDTTAADREHTAYTVGLLGPLARPLSADVMKLCTDPEEKVRGAAFDALRVIGVTDVPGFAALLTHENREVGRLAAELISGLPEVPDAA